MEIKPEEIDITELTTASVILMEAFAFLSKGSPAEKALTETIFTSEKKPIVDVCLTINGIQVPYAKTVNQAWARNVNDFKRDAAQEIINKISGLGLHRLQTLSEDIESLIRDKFREVNIDLPYRDY